MEKMIIDIDTNERWLRVYFRGADIVPAEHIKMIADSHKKYRPTEFILMNPSENVLRELTVTGIMSLVGARVERGEEIG